MKIKMKYILSTLPFLMLGNGNLAKSYANENYKQENMRFPVREIKYVPELSVAPLVDTTAFRAIPHGRDVIYYRADSSAVKRTGGSRAWRNNNPGNLRYSDFARANGAIGECGNFAVFPDLETGFAALCTLLKTGTYQRMTIASALKRYAEDPTYMGKMYRMTGLSGKTRLCELNDDQLLMMANTIKKIEGWVPGTVTMVASANTIKRDTAYYATAGLIHTR